MSNHKAHFIGGIITTVIYLIIIVNFFSYSPSTPMTLILLLMGVLGSLLPDVDTKSKIRNILEPILIIVAIGYFFINYYVSGIIAFIMVLYRVIGHRKMFHKAWFHIILSIFIGVGMHYFIGIAYFIGFLTHKVLDKK